MRIIYYYHRNMRNFKFGYNSFAKILELFSYNWFEFIVGILSQLNQPKAFYFENSEISYSGMLYSITL